MELARDTVGSDDPTDEQVHAAGTELLESACRLLGERPALREKLIEVRKSYTQVLDETSKDEVIDAGFSRDATDRARTTVESWTTATPTTSCESAGRSLAGATTSR